MFLPRSRRSIRASVFQANFWTTNDLSSSSRWPEVARSDSCASTFSRIETFPFCPFNHYLQYPFHTAPSSTPLSHVSFITHPTTATQYITFNFRLSFVLSKHHSIKSTNVYNSSIHVITYTSYFGNNKGGKKKSLEESKERKITERNKKFLHEKCPFHFFHARLLDTRSKTGIHVSNGTINRACIYAISRLHLTPLPLFRKAIEIK